MPSGKTKNFKLSLKRAVAEWSTKKSLKSWLPVAILIFGGLLSFAYSWYLDPTHPTHGAGWADQTVYTSSANHMADGRLPTRNDLHFTIGYPLLGVVGHFIRSTDPFMPVSLSLFLGSILLCYFALKKLLGYEWALLGTLLIFVNDGRAGSLDFASEIFAVPWNNQVMFFAFAFFFWLLATRLSKPPGYKFAVLAGLVTGWTFLSREEAIIFVVPLLAVFLFLSKAKLRMWLVGFGVMVLCFLPQLAMRNAVFGSFTSSGRDKDEDYSEAASNYLQPDLLYRNTWETIVDSRHYDGPDPKRRALLQVAPWLILGPVGIAIILFSKKYPLGLKLFTLISCGLLIFYLSGANMAARKLKFHCLRYITPGLIILNVGTLVTVREGIILWRKKVDPAAKLR